MNIWQDSKKDVHSNQTVPCRTEHLPVYTRYICSLVPHLLLLSAITILPGTSPPLGKWIVPNFICGPQDGGTSLCLSISTREIPNFYNGPLSFPVGQTTEPKTLCEWVVADVMKATLHNSLSLGTPGWRYLVFFRFLRRGGTSLLTTVAFLGGIKKLGYTRIWMILPTIRDPTADLHLVDCRSGR